jgi:hypothetical protein
LKTRTVPLLALLILGLVVTTQAETELFSRFKDAYGNLGSDLGTKPPAEVAEIANFTYTKDLATFTFTEGKIYLLRKLEGRPTTAIFLGTGHAAIEVPSHIERQSLWYASGDSLVDETFEVSMMNFSDDLDLKLREQFQFEETVLSWRDFNNSQQGEFFFKPVVMHQYDNYFQLLRSQFERKEDGYFWIDFNRYCYSFDPNRPEETIVAYEHEGGDIEPTNGAVMQRREKGVYDNYRMSDIAFPTTMLTRKGELRMVGLDGKNIDRASVECEVLINADSLRFVSLFLHHNLTLDSLFLEGAPAEYWRRGSFTFFGVVLPEYRFRGDTVSLRVVYHGTEYGSALPFVENPAPTSHDLVFDIHTGYNYVMPAMSPLESAERGRTRFAVIPAEPYRMFRFQPYASGFDTVNVISEIGITLSFLQSSHIDKHHFNCFIPHEQYQQAVTSAFNFVSGRLGPPLASFAVSVYPEPCASMPGLMGVSQTDCHADGTGGLVMQATEAAAQQHFGALMMPATDREFWLMDALPDYLSMLGVAKVINSDVFFGELRRRRDHIYTVLGNDEDRPLASGRRISAVDRKAKGAWIFHMLRCMIVEKPWLKDDRAFWRYLNELKILTNTTLYTNEDVIRLSEKHYGEPLDWFFKHWLYERYIPEYKVEYRIEERDGAHIIAADVLTEKVPADFKMPVVMQVVSKDKDDAPVYLRRMIEGNRDSFELGPFEFEPKELVFNELHSVLSKDKVNKK